MEQFLSTVVTSALVATIAGAAINAWLENRKSKHAARFDALSAAVSLEGYAITCANELSNHELAMSSGGHAGSSIGNVPELPQLSVVAGFLKPKRAEVADRLMTFPQEVRQASQLAGFMWDVTADEDVVREAAATQSAKMGLRALELAKDLRKVFRLPPRQVLVGKFNVEKVLLESHRNDEPKA